FTVSLKRPNDPDIKVLAHDDAALMDVTEERTAKGAKTVFEYSLAGGQIRLSLTFALSGDEELRCSASIRNRMEETDVIRLKFPILEGIRLGEKSEDDVLVVPQHAGRIVKNPSKAGIVSLKYQGSASMCWEDLSDAKAGVYLAAYDPELRNTAIECRPSKTSGRVDMWLEKAHRIRARFGRAQYDYSVAIHEGDWHRGADLYRHWFYENMGRAEHPDWLRNADGWLAFMIMNSAAPFKTLPKWYDIGRWHGMNFLQCWGQANKPVGNCCPTYYYPSPFFGTVEEFAAANKAVRDAGGHIGYYFHSQSLNRFNLSMPWIHTEIDRKLIPRYLQPPTYDFFFRNALVGPDGKMPGPPNYKAFWQRKNAGKHANDFPRIVPWSDEWQNYIEFWAVWQYAAQWHADTFYFDVMGVSHSRESFNPMRDENGEGLTGQGMLNLVRNVLTKSKPYAPEAVASGEGCADSYGRLGFHMVSGFAKSPEVFRYTLPDQILYHGHLNTGHATPRAVFEKDHLYGMRYDLLMR
ncbi:MAG: DUF6259 domain-containing protein, partial [Planctomycetota bacterium]|nr:DUF6259 domain-containing protein [Planctomycetota bacterium]